MIKREFNCYDLGDVADLIGMTPEEFERTFEKRNQAQAPHTNPNRGLLKITEEQKPQEEPQK